MIASLVAVLPLLAAFASASPLTHVKRDYNALIHPNGDTSLCLVVLAGGKGIMDPSQVVDGSELQVLTCNGLYQFGRWDIVRGDQLSIRLSGSNQCIDAGIGPHNNGPAKTWTCYPGLEQQHWYYTDDNHIAITGGNQCLDRKDGGYLAQTYQCIGGNPNQIWTVDSGSSTPPSSAVSSMASATATASVTASASASATPPNPYSSLIHFGGDNVGNCLTVQAAQGIKAGSDVNVFGCGVAQSPYAYLLQFQQWVFTRGPTDIRPVGDNTLCLDFGADSDGSKVKLQKCNGSSTQKLYYTGDNRIAIEGGKTCLDAALNSAVSGPAQDINSFYNYRGQAWTCTTGNTQQVWTV